MIRRWRLYIFKYCRHLAHSSCVKKDCLALYYQGSNWILNTWVAAYCTLVHFSAFLAHCLCLHVWDRCKLFRRASSHGCFLPGCHGKILRYQFITFLKGSCSGAYHRISYSLPEYRGTWLLWDELSQKTDLNDSNLVTF